MATLGKESGNGVYEFPYMRPPQKSGWQAFCDSLYNPSNGTVLGRNGKSWGQILFFYAIFYLALSALFYICLTVMLSTIDDRTPRRQQADSLIGVNPGMGFRPLSDRTEEGSLVWYNTKMPETKSKWIKLLNSFLEEYLRDSSGSNQRPCNFDKVQNDNKACVVNITTFGDCSNENQYGYNGSSPCVFLKLNKIFGWKPEFYNDPENLPVEMPDDLKDHITGLKNSSERNQIWVSCSGENPVDKESLSEIPFEYFPGRGFPSYYYPYTNVPDYASPLVAVKVNNPKGGIIVNIECRAWARNIEYRGGNRDRKGSVHFEVMRDDEIPSTRTDL